MTSTGRSIAAKNADRLFASSLVCASATANAVRNAGFGVPTYVITGRFRESPEGGEDDLVTAQLIERARLGVALAIDATKEAVANSVWAQKIGEMNVNDVHPDDIAYSVDVDRFDFAMEVERVGTRLRLVPRSVGL